jgi:hypothetical protein
MVLGGVGDVLADPLLAGASQTHDRRDPRELGRYGQLESFELVRVDLELESGDGVVRGQGYAGGVEGGTAAGSRLRSTPSRRASLYAR